MAVVACNHPRPVTHLFLSLGLGGAPHGGTPSVEGSLGVTLLASLPGIVPREMSRVNTLSSLLRGMRGV